MKVKIKKMPDKETLEAYIGQEEVSVIFNTEKGIFEWTNERAKRHHSSKKRIVINYSTRYNCRHDEEKGVYKGASQKS